MATAAEKLGSVKKWDHWIGGKATPSGSGQYFDDLNPDDDTVYAQLAAGTAEGSPRKLFDPIQNPWRQNARQFCPRRRN
jgi:hypothetical protein